MPYVRDVESQIMIVRAVCDITEQRGESAEPSEKRLIWSSWGEEEKKLGVFLVLPVRCLGFGEQNRVLS